jgi:hypothetical protein
MTPGTESVRAVASYPAMVKVVELLADGRMMQGDASFLAKGVWAFRMNDNDLQRGLTEALRLLAREESVLKADTDAAGLLLVIR